VGAVVIADTELQGNGRLHDEDELADEIHFRTDLFEGHRRSVCGDPTGVSCFEIPVNKLAPLAQSRGGA
jgi:hypothetical protein